VGGTHQLVIAARAELSQRAVTIGLGAVGEGAQRVELGGPRQRLE
jgi:hypothetical protein